MRRGRHALGVEILISVFDLSRDATVVDLSGLLSSRIDDEQDQRTSGDSSQNGMSEPFLRESHVHDL